MDNLQNKPKRFVTLSKKVELEKAKKLNETLGLPQGVNWEGEGNILDFGKSPRLSKLKGVMRHFCIGHMAGYYGGLEVEGSTLKLLDAGAGFAEIWAIMTNMRKARDVKFQYVGVDVDFRKQKRSLEAYPNIDYRLADFTKNFDEVVPEKDFDIIVSSEVLEHMHKSDAIAYLEACKTRLSDVGTFILDTPNEAYDSNNPWHLYEWPHDELKQHLLDTDWIIVDEFFMHPFIKDIERKIHFDNRASRMPSELIRAAMFGNIPGAISVFALQKV